MLISARCGRPQDARPANGSIAPRRGARHEQVKAISLRDAGRHARLSGFGKESFEWMSNAFSEWLGNANRMQAEVIRFMGDRYSKDVKMMTRFAECRKPEDFLKLQSEARSGTGGGLSGAGRPDPLRCSVMPRNRRGRK